MEEKNANPLTPTGEQEINHLMRQEEAAQFLGFTPRALEQWRVNGKGPRFVKVSSRAVRYRRNDLIEWADKRVVSSTSEKSAAQSTKRH